MERSGGQAALYHFYCRVFIQERRRLINPGNAVTSSRSSRSTFYLPPRLPSIPHSFTPDQLWLFPEHTLASEGKETWCELHSSSNAFADFARHIQEGINLWPGFSEIEMNRRRQDNQVGDIPARCWLFQTAKLLCFYGNRKKCTWPPNNLSSNGELCSGPTAQTSFLAASGLTKGVV